MDSITSVTPKALPRIPWIGTKLFYGWFIVIIGAVSQFLNGIISQGFSTYLSPLEKEFGWSKTLLALPRSASSVENSVLGPLEGFLVDRFGPRLTIIIGMFFMGLGAILFGLTHSLWMYMLSNIIIALGAGPQGLLVSSVAVNNWFRRKRSLAQAVMLTGFSMAGVIAIPAIVFVQTAMGWRTSAIGTGILIWVVGIPCAMLLRTRPEPYGLLPDGETPGAVASTTAAKQRVAPQEFDFTLREAIRTRAFWLLAIGWGIANLGMAGTTVHVFLHLEQGVGLTRTAAALVWTVASLSNLPARLGGGFFGDRLPKTAVLGYAMLFGAVSSFVLAFATSMEMALVYAVFYGISWGIRTPVMSAIQADYFGLKSQGIIRGWLQTISLPFAVAGPLVTGYMADLQGSYRSIFIVLSFVTLAGAAFFFVAKAPRPPHRLTPAHSQVK